IEPAPIPTFLSASCFQSLMSSPLRTIRQSLPEPTPATPTRDFTPWATERDVLRPERGDVEIARGQRRPAVGKGLEHHAFDLDVVLGRVVGQQPQRRERGDVRHPQLHLQRRRQRRANRIALGEGAHGPEHPSGSQHHGGDDDGGSLHRACSFGGGCGTGGFSGWRWPHCRHVRSTTLASKCSMALLSSFSMSATCIVTSWSNGSQRSQNHCKDSVWSGPRLTSITSPHVPVGRWGACGVRAGISMISPSRITCSWRRPPSMYSRTMSPRSM